MGSPNSTTLVLVGNESPNAFGALARHANVRAASLAESSDEEAARWVTQADAPVRGARSRPARTRGSRLGGVLRRPLDPRHARPRGGTRVVGARERLAEHARLLHRGRPGSLSLPPGSIGGSACCPRPLRLGSFRGPKVPPRSPECCGGCPPVARGRRPARGCTKWRARCPIRSAKARREPPARPSSPAELGSLQTAGPRSLCTPAAGYRAPPITTSSNLKRQPARRRQHPRPRGRGAPERAEPRHRLRPPR